MSASSPPRGTKTMVDLHRIGGTSVLLKHLVRAGIVDGSRIAGFLNDKLLIEHTAARSAAGHVGLWAKADSVTSFKELRFPAARRSAVETATAAGPDVSSAGP